jgi:hypothetical protein
MICGPSYTVHFCSQNTHKAQTISRKSLLQFALKPENRRDVRKVRLKTARCPISHRWRPGDRPKSRPRGMAGAAFARTQIGPSTDRTGTLLPRRLNDATVHKHRANNRVVAVDRRQVFGTQLGLGTVLAQSADSHGVNTSFVERRHTTDVSVQRGLECSRCDERFHSVQRQLLPGGPRAARPR